MGKSAYPRREAVVHHGKMKGGAGTSTATLEREDDETEGKN